VRIAFGLAAEEQRLNWCCASGVYGDVSRVKIMFNKKDTALVQFADPGQAQIGELAVTAQRLAI